MTGEALFHVLFAMAAVILVGRLLAALFARVHQPAVIGEVCAGILLGPSLLGRIFPRVSEALLPESVAPLLHVIAQLGVILYMFVVGMELDLKELREKARTTVWISLSGIATPFFLATPLAWWIYPSLGNPDKVPFYVFSLFLGISMAVTAFPVLARILTDRRMNKSDIGVTALASAAIGDALAWCLLAIVAGTAHMAMQPHDGAKIVSTAAGNPLTGAVGVILWMALYLGAMLLAVRPGIAWMIRSEERKRSTENDGLGEERSSHGSLSHGTLAAVFGLLLTSAMVTEWIGVHAIFGAFVFGAIVPHDSSLAKELRRRLEDVVSVLLLPAFFALTGMRTELGLMSGLGDWLTCGVIIAVATAGKFGGTYAAARFVGIDTRKATALGILMNTRGLMELIVLDVGLNLGVLSPRLYAMLVVMALVTTIATSPLLRVVMKDERSASGGF